MTPAESQRKAEIWLQYYAQYRQLLAAGKWRAAQKLAREHGFVYPPK